MAFNPFLGKDRKWLESELAKAQEDLARGKATLRAGSGDIFIQSALDVSIGERVRNLLLALNKVAPDDFPIESIMPTSSTKAVFS
jgi:hypothetical protein